jgi:colanic acid/amylovoran biosynthesis glycosyltransferase
MREQITRGRGAPGAATLHTADFHAWLARPARALAAPAGRLLARLPARHPRAVALAVRCARQGLLRHFLAALWLSDVLRGQPFVRVHSHFATDPAQVGALLAQLAGVPFTVTTHAADIFVPRQPRRLPRLLASAAQVLTISEYNRRHLEQSVAGIAPRLRVVRLGVDLAALPRWQPSPGSFSIACTASGLGEKKGLEVLLDACRLLRARGMAFDCRIVGADPGGTRLAALQERIGEHGLARHVHTSGALPWSAAQQLVARCGVFVHPSVRTADGDMDGIPVSLIEAMGIGVPVVASRLSGIPELVEHGRNGLLVPPGDAAALAEAIARIANHTASADAMGRQARHRVRAAFALSRHVDALLDVWGESHLVAAPGTTSGVA